MDFDHNMTKADYIEPYIEIAEIIKDERMKTKKSYSLFVMTKKLQSNFIEIILRHGCSPVNLFHIFRTPFLKNTSEGLLLKICPV